MVPIWKIFFLDCFFSRVIRLEKATVFVYFVPSRTSSLTLKDWHTTKMTTMMARICPMVTSLSLLALAVASYEAEFLLALGAWVRVALIERNRRNGGKTMTWVIFFLSLRPRKVE